jgi:tRNA-dihydrouridine synthase
LLKDLSRAREVFQAVRKAVAVSLTVKTGRDGTKGPQRSKSRPIGRGLRRHVLTVHGRTRSQGYGVKADWKAIARVKEHLHIPVIGNGIYYPLRRWQSLADTAVPEP